MVSCRRLKIGLLSFQVTSRFSIGGRLPALRRKTMFPGFPTETLTFFKRLARNNNRDWFLQRKEIFEASVKAPMIALVETLNADFAKCAPDYVNDPKKAVYRIYRDVRFSSDKSPYKTHLAAAFPRR